MNVLETEYHYLLVCPKFYNEDRNILKILLYMAFFTQTNTSIILNLLFKTYQNLHSLPIKQEGK